MDFSFNQDQEMIAETADTFLADVSGSAAVRSAMDSEQGFDPALWGRITEEMGWQLTHIPESFDGLGLGYVELCILLERMGKNLLCSPFFATSCLASNALLVAATEQQKTDAFAEITASSARYALAYSDKGRKWGIDSVSAQYKLTDSGVLINGSYSYVIDGHTADTIIVAARSEVDEGIGLFIVSAKAQGIKRHWTPSMDQTRKLAELNFENVEVSSNAIMGQLGKADELLQQILSLASIALAAEQLGVAEKSLALTTEYISERSQFGRPVGGFQAMKHKAADMMNRAEAARSAVYYAACIADEFLHGSPLGAELHEAASIAKSYSCDAAFFNAGCAIQMHGGVGFSWEYDVHLYFKRAKAAQLSFGDSAWHRERIASIVLGVADNGVR